MGRTALKRHPHYNAGKWELVFMEFGPMVMMSCVMLFALTASDTRSPEEQMLPTPLFIALCVSLIVGCYKLYLQWPRGWVGKWVLDPKPSNVVGGGLGLFAGQSIPAGAVLGSYPGRKRTEYDYILKLRTAPSAQDYCLPFPGNISAVRDPTDATGKLLKPLSLFEDAPAFLRWLSKPTILALINEPVGAGVVDVSDVVNAELAARNGSPVFVTTRALVPGEEIYIFYGDNYDRSHYAKVETKAEGS